MAQDKAEAVRKVVDTMNGLDQIECIHEVRANEGRIIFEVDRSLAVNRFNRLLSDDPFDVQVVISALGTHTLRIKDEI